MEKATVYSFATCPYCVSAKQLLTQKGYEYDEIVIDRSQIKDLVKKTKMMTVPQIFIGEEFIGGYDNLVEYFANKE